MQITMKRINLFSAILWSVVSAVWMLVFVVCLILLQFAGVALPVLSGIAAAVSAVKCVFQWRRYLKTPKET